MKEFAKFLPFLLALAFVACGDDDSDFASRPSDDSSSSICEDCDDDGSSSSSQKQGDGGSEAAMTSSSAKSSSSSSEESSSSSKEKSSSSVKGIPWNGPKEKYFNPDVNYGTITDARDGKIYRTVQIGNQTWMAENLNFEYKVARGEGDTVSYGICSTDNCEISGRYYTWAAAMDSAAVFSQNSAGCGFGHKCSRKNPVRGICPEGWHIPTGTEWETLYKEVGETAHALQAKGFEEWSRATDEFGFSALPVGLYYEGEILHIGNAYFWSTSEYDNTNAWDWYLGTNDGSLGHSFLNVKRDHFSVRCLKDESSVQQSSSSVASSSSTPEGYVDPSTVVTGIMTDERDGQTYKTVTIGTQTWMAENLNYAYLQPTATLDSSSFCYNHEAAKCDEYGRLYMWSAAMDSVGVFSEDGKGCGWHSDSALVDTVQGVCPEGWHLPSAAEFLVLVEAVGGLDSAGLKLKSTSGWKKRSDGTSGNGIDSYGFNALAAGAMVKLEGIGFESLDVGTNFWTSTQKKRNFYIGRDDDATLYSNYEDFGYSVRCVKD